MKRSLAAALPLVAAAAFMSWLAATAPAPEAAAQVPRWEPDSTGISLQLLMDADGDGVFDLTMEGDPVYRWDRPSLGKFQVVQRDSTGWWYVTTEGFMAFDVERDSSLVALPDSGTVDLVQFARFARSFGDTLLYFEGGVELWQGDLGTTIYIPHAAGASVAHVYLPDPEVLLQW